MQKASSHPVHSKSQHSTFNHQRRINYQPQKPAVTLMMLELWNFSGVWILEFEVSILLHWTSLDSEWTGLLHIVGIWFQELFHSANSGSFHLSLAVLVHYRLPRSI